MTWIKICGTTNLEDALLAVEAGADALGFVFHAKSPRNVSVETVREIVAQLPERVEKVGVFVEQDAEEIAGVVYQTGLTAVQLHGGLEESALISQELLERGVRRMFPVFPAGLFYEEGAVDIKGRADSENSEVVVAIVVDSGTAEQRGGTGKAFEWRRVAAMEKFTRLARVVIAGGLTPGNVAEAMRILNPWGVDVVSGVEAAPGKKDPEKVRAFVRAVREVDLRAGRAGA
jgi:phosphoribosylanthranilate isomerase